MKKLAVFWAVGAGCFLATFSPQNHQLYHTKTPRLHPKSAKTLEKTPKHHAEKVSEFPPPPAISETADQEFPLVDHLRRQMVVEREEELFVAHNLLTPLGAVDGL